jgi:hypothetical protein
LRPRRQRAFTVEGFCDCLDAVPVDRQLEDTTDDEGLIRLDLALDVRPLVIRSNHIDVAVAETAAASDVARVRLPHHRIARALPCLFALEVRRERHRTEQELIGRALHQEFAILEI